MYTPNVVGRFPIVYFEDTITRPDRLIDHIEEINNNSLSHDLINPWNNGQKTISDDIKSNEINLNRKSMYIKNSFLASSMFCFTQYSEAFKLPLIKNPKSFILIKTEDNNNENELLMLDNDEVKFYCFVFLNDNYVGGDFSFPKQNIKFKPRAGSMLVFPKSDTFEWYLDPIKQGIAYRAAINGFSEAAMV
jgi:hypothetical protein